MPQLTSNAISASSCRDHTGLIYIAFINNDEQVKIIRVTPNGNKINFIDNTAEKAVTGITATACALEIKNSILILKYIDLDGNLQQRFSRNMAETWTINFDGT
ncbi:MAG: hypothetical protein AABY07_10840 [Nanoarchaeota archaeon]